MCPHTVHKTGSCICHPRREGGEDAVMHIAVLAGTGSFSLIGDPFAISVSLLLTSASHSLIHRTFLQVDDN
jgi:hypothetical protein